MSAHGTVRQYQSGCRCATCRNAKAANHRAYRNRRRSREGLPPVDPEWRTRRCRKEREQLCRIEQAIARGDRTAEIMAALDVSYETVQRVRSQLELVAS